MRHGRKHDWGPHEMSCAGAALLAVVLVLPLLSRSDGGNLAATGGVNNLSWHTIDSGGATFSTGGGYVLGGTIGQPDATAMMGGTYEFAGGFWFGCLLADGDCDSDVDTYDFEEFQSCLTGPDGVMPEPHCTTFDSDDSGDVSLRDFAAFQTSFSG